MLHREIVVLAVAVALLASCGEEAPEYSPPVPVPCRTQGGTFTMTGAQVSSTCPGQTPAMPASDYSFESGECGVNQYIEKTTKDGCSQEIRVEITGNAAGYTGTSIAKVDCSASDGVVCEIHYNLYFDKR